MDARSEIWLFPIVPDVFAGNVEALKRNISGVREECSDFPELNLLIYYWRSFACSARGH